MTYKTIAFLGIDGSGKSKCIDTLAHRLRQAYSVISLSWERSEYYYRGAYAIQNEYLIPPFCKAHAISRGVAYAERQFENPLTAEGSRQRIAIYLQDRDTVIDPAIMWGHYIPGMKKLPLNVRISLIKLLPGTRLSDRYIFLDTQPEVAMERIRQRNPTAKLASHESEETLRSLRGEYLQVVSYFQKNQYDPLVIDTTDKSADEVCEIVWSDLKPSLIIPDWVR